MDIELLTDHDSCMVYIVSPPAGLGGASRLQLACLFILLIHDLRGLLSRVSISVYVSVRPSVLPSACLSHIFHNRQDRNGGRKLQLSRGVDPGVGGHEPAENV